MVINRRLVVLLTTSVVLAFHATRAQAHEFWIDPISFTPTLKASVPIVFRIGSDFQGVTYPYVRSLDRGFSILDSRGAVPIKTLDGDDPAAEVRFRVPGLTTIWHRRAPEPVVFDTMAKFEETLVDEGLEAIGEQHRASGKPLTKIREVFSRCAKALLQVGGAGGVDRAVGMPLEFVAAGNPYDHPADKPLSVQLLLDGKPLAGALVKIFIRENPQSSGLQTPKRVRTSAEGRVDVDVSRSGEYLIAAVSMKPATAGEKADWSSIWTSLTFARR
jgi:uncharacterized GH25 family protein